MIYKIKICEYEMMIYGYDHKLKLLCAELVTKYGYNEMTIYDYDKIKLMITQCIRAQNNIELSLHLNYIETKPM